MSTASLPSYHYEPQDTEQRLARHLHAARRPPGTFVKNSRNGGVSLRLIGQLDDATLPEYGRSAFVDGTIELRNTDTVQSVEVKIEGSLRLKEIAEGGTSISELCLDVKTLWNRDRSSEQCPTSLAFSLTLPSTFSDGKNDYPLPPTYEAHLSGVPGFAANIGYAVSAVVTRRKVSLFGLANTTVSTPFIYRPRSRPAIPNPTSLTSERTHPNAIANEDWTLHQGTIKSKSSRNDDLLAKIFLPASRVFCMTDVIPFHLFFIGSAFSLAAFLPFAPTTSGSSHSSDSDSSKVATRVNLLRQSAVDVRSITKRHPLPVGNNTDIWKIVQIGDSVFRRYEGAGGQDWVGYYGEIRVDSSVKVGGFKASGLSVKDYVVLSVAPPDPGKSPFMDLRIVIPMKLTTDSWTGDLAADEYGVLGYSDHSDPDLDAGVRQPSYDFEGAAPELRYDGYH